MRPIGIFDSGFGGLTIFKSIKTLLPQYDYCYLGDNARAPYGNRSFETVYEYTLSCVKWLYDQGCPLVILACNTASAKALRTIQKNDLASLDPKFRVLGVIRPTAETIGSYSQTGSIGILATQGTVQSKSYEIELHKFFPELKVYQQACPLWVPFIENEAYLDDAFNPIIQKDVNLLLSQNSDMDVVLMACTHYPIIKDRIMRYLPNHIKLIGQGDLVATSLAAYLKKHTDIEQRITQTGERLYFTTDAVDTFNAGASVFLEERISAQHVHI